MQLAAANFSIFWILRGDFVKNLTSKMHKKFLVICAKKVLTNLLVCDTIEVEPFFRLAAANFVKFLTTAVTC